MSKFSHADAEQLDEHIFQRNILGGIKFIQERLTLTLHQALDVFSDQYQTLRKSKGDRFTTSEEEYWEGFNS